jgi:hypothetical protein
MFSFCEEDTQKINQNIFQLIIYTTIKQANINFLKYTQLIVHKSFTTAGSDPIIKTNRKDAN